MTCTPVPTEAADGSVTYHFETTNAGDKQAAIEDFEDTEEYYEMEDGNFRHILADTDLSPWQYDPEEGVELTSEDFQSGVTSEDMGEIIEGIGLEEFGAMSNWAHQNLGPQAQAKLESIIASGDVPAISDAFHNLFAFYQSNAEYDAPVNRRQQNVQDQQTTNALQSIVGGGENYNQLLDMARETFSDDQIDRYNAVMDNGTNEQRAVAVRWLAQQFN